MTTIESFEQYLTSESASDRQKALSVLAGEPHSPIRSLLIWKALGLMPTKPELSSIASSIRIGSRSSADWGVVTRLLGQGDQDIIGNTINSLTFSKNRALGHRAVRFFQSAERPQRVLYCLARYAEEAVDRRFAQVLSQFMQSDLSDAFLARSFNALFKLGIRDHTAVDVAMTLLQSHIEATNMDRKAAVSAAIYLCFAGSQADIEKLGNLRKQVSIPELRRLLNWGLSEIEAYKSNGFGPESFKSLLDRSLHQTDPNFSGFGCFAEDVVKTGVKEYLSNSKVSECVPTTRMILDLGEAHSINQLANHPLFGLKAIRKKPSANGKTKNSLTAKQQSELKDLWLESCPTQAQEFLSEICEPKAYEFWHGENPEKIFYLVESKHFEKASPNEKSIGSGFLQKVIRDALKHENWLIAIDVICAQVLAFEKLAVELQSKAIWEKMQQSFGDAVVLKFQSTKREESIERRDKRRVSLEASLVDNLKDLIEAMPEELIDTLSHRVLGALIGADVPQSFFQSIIEVLPPSHNGWALCALAHSAQIHGRNSFESFLGAELKRLSLALHSSNNDEDLPLFEQEATSLYQSLLASVPSESTDFPPSSLLDKLHDFAHLIQGILDQILPNSPPDDRVSSEDWGQSLMHRPLATWNSILQVRLASELNDDLRKTTESALKDAMRVATHVEKRWVIRALVDLGTDDAIKAILYQAIQHVDNELVNLTIRELLRSKHPRAQQALIRCVGRNTISDDLKLTILDELTLDNPKEVLHELKTLEILRLPAHIDDAVRDAVGRVSVLTESSESVLPRDSQVSSLASIDIDSVIRNLLPQVDKLSVESKSALRTAEMILVQSKEWGDEAVDLSPIVNMHFKAVELTMRETFEAFTDAVIRKGVLGRKLDILGYARPIPEKMQIFEDHLSQLPTIRTIPYFSKFKLRKMLRAVCLYRPGKRFTLDGPKAFALFFLTGSRSKCDFGLAGTVPLPFDGDTELFEFIKLVHSLQDSRNRAVHEGLTWEAEDEIESMRSQAYEIIQTCLRLSELIPTAYKRLSSDQPQLGVVS